MNKKDINQLQDTFLREQEVHSKVIDLKSIITAALISVLTATTIPQTMAKPQNARSKMINQFHSDTFGGIPPFRSQCPSWQEVLGGGIFEKQEDTLKDVGKSTPLDLDWQDILEHEKFDQDKFVNSVGWVNRPCFVLKTGHVENMFDYAGNDSFGRNYSVYSNFGLDNHFHVDIPLTFYTGGIGGSDGETYKTFTSHLQTCLQTNPIPLKTKYIPEDADQEEREQRSLDLSVPVMISHEEENKYDKYRENEYYKDTILDASVFGVNLHTELKRNNIENWSVNISCADITKQLLTIVGLHDTHHASSTYDGLIPTDTNSSLRGLQRRYCKNYSGEDCEEKLISEGRVQVQGGTPIFDCREDDIYGQPNIMNYEKIFDIKNFPVGLSICKSRVNLSTTTDNVDISVQHKKDTRVCDIGDKSVLETVLSSEDELENADKYIKKKLAKPGEVYYIAHYNRKEEDISHSLTNEQFSAILYPNYLLDPDVRSFAETAQNAYRTKHTIKGPYNGCRK